MAAKGALSLVKFTVTCIVFAVICAAGWLLWQQFKIGDVAGSYQSCLAAGNPVQESYPETCVDKDGRRYTNPDTKQQPASP